VQYTAVIRTLGTAGKKYQQLLRSLDSQTIQPSKIIVYIAEGYPVPIETIHKELYIYVRKGMVAQRALPYTEVDTEYIFCLDDDLSFPPDTVEQMYNKMVEHNADVISPDIFPNAQRSLVSEMMMTLSARMRARRHDTMWGYKVMRTSGYSYNKKPQSVMMSQTNAGAAFLCRKEDFLNTHFEDELWLDEQQYPLGEDQVMYYKMYLKRLKILTWYNHGFMHLDAGGNMNPEKEKQLIYSDFRFKTIFWHRFIWPNQKNILQKMWSVLCIAYAFVFALGISFFKGQWHICRLKCNAIQDGISFIRSEGYRILPKVL
jgi:glycosyltransferase involved in cell wall biosynthesis